MSTGRASSDADGQGTRPSIPAPVGRRLNALIRRYLAVPNVVFRWMIRAGPLPRLPGPFLWKLMPLVVLIVLVVQLVEGGVRPGQVAVRWLHVHLEVAVPDVAVGVVD
jgi:hypothetical protein